FAYGFGAAAERPAVVMAGMLPMPSVLARRAAPEEDDDAAEARAVSRFAVQLGPYATRRSAQAVRARLARRGYTAMLTGRTLRLGSFSSEGRARRLAGRLRLTGYRPIVVALLAGARRRGRTRRTIHLQQDILRDPRRMGQAGAGRPPEIGLVPRSDHPDVVRLVRILDGIGIREAQLLAQELDVLGLAGEEQPARPHAVQRRVLLERLGGVFLGLQRDRVEEDVAADPVAEQLLHPHQVGGHRHADPLTPRVHEVDHHLLVL